MPNRTSRVQSFFEEYSLDARINFVLEGLNGVSHRKLRFDRSRLSGLVHAFKALDVEWDNAKGDARLRPGSKFAIGTWQFAREAWGDVHQRMSAYVGYPSLVGIGGDEKKVPDSIMLTWFHLDGTEHVDMQLALDVFAIFQSGKIGSLRECETCGQWLYARFPHQRFCSAECKDQFHTTNEADKKRRREWAKANYQSRKELELGSRKAAQRKGTK